MTASLQALINSVEASFHPRVQRLAETGLVEHLQHGLLAALADGRGLVQFLVERAARLRRAGRRRRRQVPAASAASSAESWLSAAARSWAVGSRVSWAGSSPVARRRQ